MLRRVLGYLDVKRGCAVLAASLAGPAISAWEHQAHVAAAASGLGALVVGALTLNAYLTGDRVEVALPPGTHAGDGDDQRNIHVVPPKS